ncbi:MAG: hypothetical protein SO037_03460 [Treponema berlinense]|uniref:hypothetical protein n=1 Tax=Treponema berlinense TaxID=225004 RepID=UPI002A819D7B|nr:hypothetical protein [Treponema berlinense]MDY3707613.1 hypothetical protein [Treponema berlinense]
MKKRTFNLISVVIAAIFVFTAVYFIAGIVSDKKNGPLQAEEIFDSLVIKTQNAANSYPLSSYNFSDSFIRAAGDFSNYQKLNLSVDGKLIYSYPSKDIYFSRKSGAKSFTKSFTTKNGNSILINAEIYTTVQSSLFYHARTAFIVIFAATLAAILILIFAKTEKDEIDGIDEISFEDETESTDKEIFSQNKTDEISSEKQHDEYALTEEEKKQLFDGFDTVDFSQNENKDEKIFSENTDTEEEKSCPKTQPIENLEAKCEEALVKAAENGSDLAVLIIKVNSSENEISLEQIENIFDSDFAQNALVFSDESNLFTVLLENTGLDDAMTVAKEIFEDFSEKLTDAGQKVTIGLSSKTGRTVSSERLLTEAREAQKHAATEPDSPIIAFRASPEKYNDYILNK